MCEKYEEVGNGSIRMSVSELSPFLRPHQKFKASRSGTKKPRGQKQRMSSIQRWRLTCSTQDSSRNKDEAFDAFECVL